MLSAKQTIKIIISDCLIITCIHFINNYISTPFVKKLCVLGHIFNFEYFIVKFVFPTILFKLKNFS